MTCDCRLKRGKVCDAHEALIRQRLADQILQITRVKERLVQSGDGDWRSLLAAVDEGKGYVYDRLGRPILFVRSITPRGDLDGLIMFDIEAVTWEGR